MTSLRHNDNQKGTTLLLSILVLAAITAIVFSISSIAVNEIQTNSDITKTEPVLKADEGIGEDALFKLLHGSSSMAPCTSPSTQTLNGVAVSLCAGAYLASPYTFDMVANDQKDLYLVNPTSQTSAPGYTSASVTITGGINGTIYLCTIDIVDCPSAPAQTRVLNPSSQPTWSSALDPSTKYQLIIVNGSGGVGSYSVSTAPNGLPSGTTTIQAVGARDGITRKLQILVPQ